MLNSIGVKLTQISIKSLKMNVSLFYQYFITSTELSHFMRYDLIRLTSEIPNNKIPKTKISKNKIP
jgi:hypothetical protein